jgi:hypothetical protein
MTPAQKVAIQQHADAIAAILGGVIDLLLHSSKSLAAK